MLWVTFYDALVYCDWLGKTLRDWDRLLSPWPTSCAAPTTASPYRVRPSRSGPRGVGKYTSVPGAMTRRRHAAPTTPTVGTSPVGCLRAGASTCRSLDRAGNVWSGHGTYGAGWLDDDNLTILDLENIILMGQIIERQRDRQTREVKCVVRSFTLDGLEAETIVKIGPTGRLVVATVYLA
jgi:hypothetical protein